MERFSATPTLHRLQDWLAGVGFAPGDRLPPERELSQTLGVSRAELRKALAVLEIDGVLQRQVGRGTYLRRVDGTSVADSAIPRLAEQTSPHEAMMARLTLEPELAALAAIHATPRQLVEARRLGEVMRTSKSWEDYERLDAEFHCAIAEAAGNSLLSELHRILNAVRVSVVWPRLAVPEGGPPADYHSFAEHDAILDALDRRDRTGAHAAMRAHLKSIRTTLLPEA